MSAGWHRCTLCRFGHVGTVTYGRLQVSVGASNLFVPADARIYVAPSLIVHTIDAHGYRPPEEFLEAVRACPPMSSMAYKRALLAAGGASLLPSRRV
ncbi:MAG: hypothetical protein AAGE52_14855 [Myxococcota bacterium]